jgi:hypothetical protein
MARFVVVYTTLKTASWCSVLYILPKLCPLIILKYEFHGPFESKMSCSQNIMLSLENLELNKVVKYEVMI